MNKNLYIDCVAKTIGSYYYSYLNLKTFVDGNICKKTVVSVRRTFNNDGFRVVINKGSSQWSLGWSDSDVVEDNVLSDDFELSIDYGVNINSIVDFKPKSIFDFLNKIEYNLVDLYGYMILTEEQENELFEILKSF